MAKKEKGKILTERKKMKTIMLTLIGVLAASAAGGLLEGIVVDSVTGEPLIGATVAVEGTDLGGFTDASGAFRIDGVQEGFVTLMVSSVGHGELELGIEESERSGIMIAMNPVVVGGSIIVVTGTGTPRFFADTPVATSVVTRDLIELRSDPDLFSILNMATGVRVENNCQNCNFSQVRIHGLEGQYTQILIDGDPVVSSLAKVYGLEQFPAEMVERIEVVKGGGSALYGGSAVAGVVNLITRRPEETGTMVELEGGYVDGGGEAGVAFTSTAADMGNVASMVIYGRLRHRKEVDVDSDGFSDIGRLRSESLGGSVFLNPAESSGLTLSGHYIHENRRGGDKIDVPDHLVDVSEGTETWRYGGSVKWEQKLSTVFDYSVNISGAYTERFSFYGGLGGEDPSSPDYDPAAGYGFTKNPLVSAQGKCNLQLGNQLFSIGVQGTHEQLEDRSFSEGIRAIDETYTDTGVFLQDDISFGSYNQYEILLGARVDDHSQVEGMIFSPRTAMKWRVNPAFTFRGGIATGFNAPQVFDEDLHIEVVGGAPRIIVNADDLREEKSAGYYFSGEYRNVIGDIPVNMVLGGFRTDLKDAFALKEVGENEFGELVFERVNESGAHVQGVEAELGVVMGSVSIIGGITLQEALYNEQVEYFEGVWSDRIMRTPNVYGNLRLDWEAARNVDVLLAMSYTGSMEVPHDTEDPVINTVDPTVTFDADVSWNMESGILENTLTVKAGVKNITNVFQEDLDQGAERDAGYVYGPASPRKITLGLELGF
ncbi:MAG: TonB-dependent receptor [Candidatus Aegiribacteria sp.]|nr:TonB-dependent receptor [Candidatus Aegiribacteria sp.]